MRMLALLLYLGSNVLRGFVLVRLLEGDLHLLVTIHELTQLSNCRGKLVHIVMMAEIPISVHPTSKILSSFKVFEAGKPVFNKLVYSIF